MPAVKHYFVSGFRYLHYFAIMAYHSIVLNLHSWGPAARQLKSYVTLLLATV